MPLLVKLLFAIGVLWSSIYSASYCAFQLKKKNVKGALAVAVLSLIMILSFGFSMLKM